MQRQKISNKVWAALRHYALLTNPYDLCIINRDCENLVELYFQL